MTNSPVVNPTVNPNQNQTVAAAAANTQLPNSNVPTESLIARKTTNEATAHHQAITQQIFNNNVRKLNMQQQQQQQQHHNQQIHQIINQQQHPGTTTRIINQQNLIALNQLSADQSQNLRVSMSALATQLASPPAIMSSPQTPQPVVQQNQNYAIGNLSSMLAPQSPTNNLMSNNKHMIINTVGNQRIMSQCNIVRRDSSVTSPGSDSNASSSSLGYTVPGLSALLATSPSSMSTDLGSNSSTINSALIERLTGNSSHSLTSPSPGPSPGPSFATPSPKNIPHQMQSPASISPLSSPPPSVSQHQQQQQQHQQTTTLNLQGLNLASLQGAMATIPGLQNVQVKNKKKIINKKKTIIFG